MICLACLRGSIYDRETALVVGKCETCGDTRPCIPGDRIALFVPYIPLQIYDLFDIMPIVDKNQCADCKGKKVMLSNCMGCHEAKCFHLMKPCSPYCRECVAVSS